MRCNNFKESKMSKKYKFDNSYEKVYELRGDAYVYIGGYALFSIDKQDDYKTAVACVEGYLTYSCQF